MAAGAALGLALLIALLFAPVALLNPPLGIAMCVFLISIENLAVVSIAPLAATLLIGFVWFGSLQARGSEILELVRRHIRVLATIALLLLWLTLSLVWAERPHLVWDLLWQWFLGGLLFLVLVTTLRDPQAIGMVVIAFVAGAVLSVMIGLFANDFDSSKTAAEAAFDQGARVQGGSGDPNLLAAGVVAALILISGLAAVLRGPLSRIALLLGAVVLAVGFAAAESRGALAAVAVALIAALVFYKGRRAWVVVFAAFAIAAAASWFAVYPAAWERISSFNNEGNGREEFWDVAWQIGLDRPFAGVGLNNYLEVSPDYVRRPGSLEFVEVIADRPHVAHNTYLQLFAEVGLVGLALFLFIVAASLRAAWLAGHRFAARGAPGLATLARSLLVATIAMAIASVFISNGGDKRLWMLLALGPALAVIAERMPQPAAPSREKHPRHTASIPAPSSR